MYLAAATLFASSGEGELGDDWHFVEVGQQYNQADETCEGKVRQGQGK